MSVGFKSQCIPQYRLLTGTQIVEIHQATLELLETTGVNTVTSLSKRDPHSLWLQLKAINREKKLVRRTPPLKKIENWVYKAKNLNPIIE